MSGRSVVAWMRDENRFHDECLVIPSGDVPWFADEDAYGHLKFAFTPGSVQGRLAQYRRRLSELPHVVADPWSEGLDVVFGDRGSQVTVVAVQPAGRRAAIGSRGAHRRQRA